MRDRLDCVVIGAGVIGLAAARSLALAGHEVVVLEAEADIGMHTSSRNSEVIHAGIYYDKDSLKAELCVNGKAQLYDYCEAHRVPYRRLGKLIVATEAGEDARLEAIRAKAAANGVDDLELLDESEARALEPAVACRAALLSPSTGIVDSHTLMLALRAEIEANDGVIVTHSRVTGIEPDTLGFTLAVEGSDERFACRRLVNAAGLYAGSVARSIVGLDPAHGPRVRLAIGHYFTLAGRSPFAHLVYPLPGDGGLGIHATNDLAGCARFGPDVEWIETIDYRFDESRAGRFAEAIRRYYPDLDEARLAPGYTGIRPKLSGPGEPARDFVIEGPSDHGLPGLVNLLGIESPGLTASLAIGDLVATRLA